MIKLQFKQFLYFNFSYIILTINKQLLKLNNKKIITSITRALHGINQKYKNLIGSVFIWKNKINPHLKGQTIGFRNIFIFQKIVGKEMEIDSPKGS